MIQVIQSVSDSVIQCVYKVEVSEITVYDWTRGGLDTLGLNCTCEHTVHGVHTEHNVHTVQLFSAGGCSNVQVYTVVCTLSTAHMC